MNAPERIVGDLSVAITVPEKSHPIHVVQGAAIGFIDRCFVFLDRPDADHIRVTLAAKESVDDPSTLTLLAEAFERKLRASDLYHRVDEDTRILNEAVVAQAFGEGAAVEPSLDDLDDFDFSGDAFADPLGIAQTWEEKHGRPAPKAPEPTEPTDTK